MNRASISAYSLASTIALALTGCSVNLATTPVSPASPAATLLDVDQNVAAGSSAAPAILELPSNSSGTATPTNSITLPVGLTLGSLATDPSDNLYVATSTDIREFAAGAIGAATPLRVLSANSTTTIDAVMSLAADAGGNLYVAEKGGGIAIFNSSANGSVAPSRYILSASQTGGNSSSFAAPGAITVDAAGNLYVVNYDVTTGPAAILVFGSTATGGAAPARVISGAQTLLTNIPQGIATDASGNLYVANFLSNVAVFAPGASGNVAPTRVVSGSSTRLGALVGLTVDPAGDIFAETNGTPNTTWLMAVPTVVSFPAGASGNLAPLTTFTPPFDLQADMPGNNAIAAN